MSQISSIQNVNSKLKQDVDLLIQVARIQSLEKLIPRLSKDGYFQDELQSTPSTLSILQSNPEEARAKLDELQNLTLTLPMEITMNNLQQRILRNDTSYSQPFYTYYKGMCLAIDAGGYGDGYGTYVLVFLLLMRGNFDSWLSWPLRGEFAIQLQN